MPLDKIYAVGREERSIEQVTFASAVDGELSKTLPQKWYRKVREMRKDATLGYLRDMISAAVLASEWTVVSDDPQFEDAVQMVYDSTVPHRVRFLKDAVRGMIDFGWQPYEVVRELTPKGYFKVTKLKALLQDITSILVDPYGRLLGVRNEPGFSSPVQRETELDLVADEALVLSFDVEGTDWYGQPLMMRAEGPYDSWKNSDDSATRFDKKMAGAHWVIYYPIGTSVFNGRETDNYDIALDILGRMESSGRVAIPQKILDGIRDLNNMGDDVRAWKIELLSAPSAQGSFIERQKYLDALKARALGVPERAVFEGQFGTKAEAEAHADFAIDNIEMRHSEIVDQLNLGVVDPLLLVNKGPLYVEHVRVQRMPLSDAKRAMLRQLYLAYVGTEAGQDEEFGERLDWDGIRELLSVPVREEELNDAAPTEVRPAAGVPAAPADQV